MSNFKDRARAKQLHSFEGMERRSNARPTDIDLFMDYNGRVFLYGEGKVKGERLNAGQTKALDAICLSYYEEETKPKWKSKHLIWLFVYEHDTKKIVVDGKEEYPDVIVKDQEIVKIVNNMFPTWLEPNSSDCIPRFELNSEGKLLVLDAIDQIEQWCMLHDVNIYVPLKNR